MISIRVELVKHTGVSDSDSLKNSTPAFQNASTGMFGRSAIVAVLTVVRIIFLSFLFTSRGLPSSVKKENYT